MRMYIYIYVYVCMYVCMYVCIYFRGVTITGLMMNHDKIPDG